MVFAEIEPYGADTAEQAISVIDAYEEMLGLQGKVCVQSIADLFRP